MLEFPCHFGERKKEKKKDKDKKKKGEGRTNLTRGETSPFYQLLERQAAKPRRKLLNVYE